MTLVDFMTISIGDGWARVSSPTLCSTFQIASYDPEAKRSKLLRLGQRSDAHPAAVSSFKSLHSNGGHLYCISDGQVVCLLDGSPEVKCVLAPSKGRSFNSMWVSPNTTEAFVLQSNRALDGEVSLVKVNLSNGENSPLIELASRPAYIGFSWPTRSCFVSSHAPDGSKAIERIELGAGKLDLVRKFPTLHGISISHRGNLVYWPLYGEGPMEEWNGDGSIACLADFGWYPAFSAKGDGAFLVGDHTLWTRTQSGEMEQVAKSGLPNLSGAMDYPSWCPCGQHVAAMLSGTILKDGWLARDLVFADLARKEIAVFENSIVDPALNIGGRVWMP